MEWIVLSVITLLIMFGGVLFYGAPYLPTLSKQTTEALDMLALSKGDTLLELGCGDGKVMVAALNRGLQVVGYELNPLLFLIAWLRVRPYGNRAKVVWGNYWHEQWPDADGIFVFLLDRYMTRLDKRITQYQHRPVKLVSFAFKVPGQVPSKESRGLYLYEYRKGRARKLAA